MKDETGAGLYRTLSLSVILKYPEKGGRMQKRDVVLIVAGAVYEWFKAGEPAGYRDEQLSRFKKIIAAAESHCKQKFTNILEHVTVGDETEMLVTEFQKWHLQKFPRPVSPAISSAQADVASSIGSRPRACTR